jgi:hypothetical protein
MNGVLSLIVLILGMFAIMNAEGRLRVILAACLLLLLFLPTLFPSLVLFWVVYVGKIIFGSACYIYLKMKGFWGFGR